MVMMPSVLECLLVLGLLLVTNESELMDTIEKKLESNDFYPAKR